MSYGIPIRGEANMLTNKNNGVFTIVELEVWEVIKAEDLFDEESEEEIKSKIKEKIDSLKLNKLKNE